MRVANRAVLQLAATLRETELVDTAEPLDRAYDREARIVALDVPDWEATLRVLEDCPEEMSIQTRGDIYTDWDVEQLAESLLEAIQDDEIGIVPPGAPGERLG